MSVQGDQEIHQTEAKKPLHHYRFTQQSLPGLRPVLTTFRAMIFLLISCFVLLAAGLALFFTENGYNEVRVRYDDLCDTTIIGDDVRPCFISLNVEHTIRGNLEMRYELTHFFQNHRRFSFSRIDAQLAGEYVDFDGMSNCRPYRSINDSSTMENWILPCGLYALSVFNDTFELSTSEAFTDVGIAYEHEKQELFKKLNERYVAGNKWLEQNPLFNNGQVDEHFIVWMRQSALPHIKKVYKKCDDCKINPGNYNLTVYSRYPAEWFGGQKYFTIARVTTIGTQNTSLGVMYLIASGICGIYAIILVFSEIISPRQMGLYV